MLVMCLATSERKRVDRMGSSIRSRACGVQDQAEQHKSLVAALRMCHDKQKMPCLVIELRMQSGRIRYVSDIEYPSTETELVSPVCVIVSA